MRNLTQRCGVEAVNFGAAHPVGMHQAALLEHCQVLRDGLASGISAARKQPGANLKQSHLAFHQQVKDEPPGGVRERLVEVCHIATIGKWSLACQSSALPSNMEGMSPAAVLDVDAIARACEAHGVRRLRVFGSILTQDFDATNSDVDFLVEFEPDIAHPFDAYFGLHEDLEAALGRNVDLVMVDAVQNPHFAASAFAQAQDVYAA